MPSTTQAGKTLVDYPAGSTLYDIPFDYLARKFVKLTLIKSASRNEDLDLVYGSDFTFQSNTSLNISISQVGYDLLRVRRETDTELLVDFKDGSVMTASNLTTSELQAIHIAEEGRDQTVTLANAAASQAEASALDSAQSALESKNSAKEAADTAESMNLTAPRDYTTGPLTFTTYKQTVRYLGNIYRVSYAVTLPYTTTGNTAASWSVDATNFMYVGDSALESRLASTSGAAMIGSSNGQNVQQRLNALPSEVGSVVNQAVGQANVYAQQAKEAADTATAILNSSDLKVFNSAADLLANVPTAANVLGLDASVWQYYNWDGTKWTAIPMQTLPWNVPLQAALQGTNFERVDASYEYVGGYYDTDGNFQTDTTSNWATWRVPVKSGQMVKAYVQVGEYTSGAEKALFTILNSDGSTNQVARKSLGGVQPYYATVYCIAPQDGFIAVTARLSGLNEIYLNSVTFATRFTEQLRAIADGLKGYGTPVQMDTKVRLWSGYGYDSNGNLTTGNGSSHYVFYIPVKAGDIVRITGQFGALNRGAQVPVLMQMDQNRKYVSTLTYVLSAFGFNTSTLYGVATQDGVIATYSRNVRPTIYRMAQLMDAVGSTAKSAQFVEITPQLTRTSGRRLLPAGTFETASGWATVSVDVSAGDVLVLDALQDAYTSGETVAVAGQFDYFGNFKSLLVSYNTTGAGPNRDQWLAKATQDGVVVLSFRFTGNSPYGIYAGRPVLKDPFDDISEKLLERDGFCNYTDNLKYEENQVVYTAQGGSLTGITGWRTMWVPVRKGESVNLYTATGQLVTGESAGAGDTIPYLIFFNTRRANPVVVASVPNVGSLTGYQTVTATAPQDGYMACRVYAVDRGWPTVRRLAKTSSGSGGSGLVPAVTGQFERLPVQADTNWDYNNCPYSQDNVVVAGGYVYVVMIGGAGRNPMIMRRPQNGAGWTTFDLSTVVGNPLFAPTALDGHNVYCIGISGNGHIVVAGNMHGKEPRAVVSTTPWEITGWKAIDFSAGLHTEGVTYPHFLTYSDGMLQVYYRYIARHYLCDYDEATQTFKNPKWIIGAKADGTGGPYEQKYVIDNDNVLHACWGYRQNASSALANEGLWYAKSTDRGANWTAADGTNPWKISDGALNDVRSTRIFNAASMSGYVNQNGGAVDIFGQYHTALTQLDSSGYTQFFHIWYDKTSNTWKNEQVTQFTFTMDLSTNLVMNDVTRPVIGCTPSGRTYIIYHTKYMGQSGHIMAIDVTKAGSPVAISIAAYDIGAQSMGFNVSQMLKTGDFMAPLAKGTCNQMSLGYGEFTNVGVMLATIPMP